MAGPIFGNSNSIPGSSGNSRHLVEFRAGRMTMVGKMVHPDNRKGLLYLHQADDGLIHFCWKNRTTNKVEDDLIIFPDDCEFKRVEQCKTGRVYLLKFKSTSARLFFWMQEPKTDKDDEWCRRINDVMNNPPSASSNRNGGGSSSDSNDLSYMLNNMSQQQLLQLFGGVGQMGGLSNILGSINRSSESSSSRSGNSRGSILSRTATTSSPSDAPRKLTRSEKLSEESSESSGSGESRRVLLSDLQNFLSGLQGINNGPKVDFTTVFSANLIDKMTTDPVRTNSLARLLPAIESTDSVKNQLKDTVASPQFQQALTSFSIALQTGQLGPVVSQFDLNSEAVEAADLGDLEQFVKALEKEAKLNSKNKDEKDDNESNPNN